MKIPIITVSISEEMDVVVARRRTRQIAELLGFDVHDRTRISTAASEIARNAFVYGGGGKVEFEIDGEVPNQMLVIRVSDRGPGIADLKRILSGRYQSTTGMGLGIIGTRRLMDGMTIDSAPGEGTTVELAKKLPARSGPVSRRDLMELAGKLARALPEMPMQEVQRQNQELLATLEELNRRQEELARLNNELEDTNRGVVALYAELDQNAEHLRRADDLKSRFLSNMSHEFRTPLNSILALSRLLLDRTDGDLTAEQEKQVMFIRKGAEALSELVNDLLDLAKVEAGKIDVNAAEFRVVDLFGALRGMLRPLLMNEAVNLAIDTGTNLPPVMGDEGKVAQILRNLVSNALKFTDAGEVRVSAFHIPEKDLMLFKVDDTGIGIPPEHLESIFQEFTQVENRLQHRVKGTGLGLPLSRKLAELIGGGLSVESTVGVGSSFSLLIPRIYTPAGAQATVVLKRHTSRETAERKFRMVLSIDDEEVSRYIIRQNLLNTNYIVSEANGGSEGLMRAREEHPDIIILDLVMPGMTGFDILERLKEDPSTGDIPVIIFTSKELTDMERDRLNQNATAILSKNNISREAILSTIERVLDARDRDMTPSSLER
ncbi:MAG: histidine kinase [Chlorobi bacterium]|nr:histidine kinase [Chlorobiota bacterium]